MKRCIILLLFLVFLFVTGCNRDFSNCSNTTASDTNNNNVSNASSNDNEVIKAVWINYYELSMKDKGGGTKDSFTEKIKYMFSKVKALGLNTVIVHVRPFSDAFYCSDIYPFSKYITGTQGKNPGYDPLKIMCEQADNYELKIHAWINPYRVLYSTNFDELAKTNPARMWREDSNPDNDDWIIVTDSGIFYNPSVPEVQKTLIDGVREIIRKYDIDAIHMDDYFYPSTDESIDKAQYSKYLDCGGKRSIADWRRDNVNIFVSGLYSAINSENTNVRFGISPAGDIQKNYDMHYADIREWVSNSGYIDFIMPQLYYGFDNQSKPFKNVATQWSELMKDSEVKICYGLAIYKCGEIDELAGAGINEWKTNDDIISRQVAYLKTLPNYDGVILYSYKFLFTENSKNETNLLKNVI